VGHIAALTDGHVPMSDEQAEIDDGNTIANLLSAHDTERNLRVMMNATYALRERRVKLGLVILDPELNVDVAFSVGRDEGGC